jgi:hypothetical protein
MASDAGAALLAAISCGEGEQRWSALSGRKSGPPEAEDELEAEVGSRSGQPHRGRTSGDASLAGDGGDLVTANFVTDEQLTLVGGKLQQRFAERCSLFVSQGGGLGTLDLVVFEEEVGVAFTHCGASGMADDEVAGRRDRVRPTSVGVEVGCTGGDLNEGLLRQVVDELRLADASCNDAPNDLVEVNEIVHQPG